MLGGIEVTGKAREHAREMLRTHMDLPPEPTDKMPAMTAKELLAQAKLAAQSSKEAGTEAKAKPAAEAARRPTEVAKTGPEAGRPVSQPAKPPAQATKPGASPPKASPGNNVIDLNTKTVARPGGKRR